MKNELELLQEIEIKRKKLQALWNQTGKTDPEILKIAQEFDILLNKYHKLRDRDKMKA